MRKITKVNGFEPQSLTQWKARNPQGNYGDLSHLERQDIRPECLKEQYYLCAYCCQTISGVNHDCMNEHVEAQHLAPQKSLDFTNIIASCTTPNQCDDSHDSQPLSLTPFMDNCETDFEFKLSGRVVGKTQPIANFREEASAKIPALALLSNLGYTFIPPNNCEQFRSKLNAGNKATNQVMLLPVMRSFLAKLLQNITTAKDFGVY